jgi:mannose-6-phosphate isomerase-like protein (cupin superfamily)
MNSMSEHARAFAPSPETPSYWMAGDRITVLLTGKETGGRSAVVVAYTVPGAGPPPHIHHDAAETFYVLDGEFTVTVDGESHLLRPGACAHVPKGTVHCFRNTGDVPANLLVMIAPAGLEAFFPAAGVPATYADTDAPPTTEEAIHRMQAVASKFHLEFVEPEPNSGEAHAALHQSPVGSTGSWLRSYRRRSTGPS